MTLKAQVLKSKDLPYFVELQGDNGESILYQIKAAGRKFGASLDKVNSALSIQFKK